MRIEPETSAWWNASRCIASIWHRRYVLPAVQMRSGSPLYRVVSSNGSVRSYRRTRSSSTRCSSAGSRYSATSRDALAWFGGSRTFRAVRNRRSPRRRHAGPRARGAPTGLSGSAVSCGRASNSTMRAGKSAAHILRAQVPRCSATLDLLPQFVADALQALAHRGVVNARVRGEPRNRSTPRVAPIAQPPLVARERQQCPRRVAVVADPSTSSRLRRGRARLPTSSRHRSVRLFAHAGDSREAVTTTLRSQGTNAPPGHRGRAGGETPGDTLLVSRPRPGWDPEVPLRATA